MARTLDIFIASDILVETLRKEITSILNIKLQPRSDGAETFFEFRDAQVVLTLGTHDLENDRDIHFEDYRYQLSVRARNIKNEVQRRKWCEEFAYSAYRKLKATGKYRLMLVDDIQVKLAAFSP